MSKSQNVFESWNAAEQRLEEVRSKGTEIPGVNTTKQKSQITLVFRLESSQKKKERLRPVIDEWQEIAEYIADIMPSFGKWHWKPQSSLPNRKMKNHFPASERIGYAGNAQEAVSKVGEAFASWKSNGCRGERPSFGRGDYMRFRGDHVSLEPRKENPVVFLKSHSSRSEDNLWFGLSVDSERQEKFIRKIRHNIWDDRTAEVYDRNGELWLHQVLQREVPVVEDDSVETVIGVDPGEVMLSTVSVVPVDDPDSPVVDHMTSGGPFRERREQRNAYRKRLQKNKGNGAKLKEQKDKQLRDTEQFLHEESVRVVEAAAEHYPAAIALEDLTGYREKAQNPIHDWPYAMFRNMIEYKAEKAGIPVKTIDPHNTSVECRECGFASQDNREDRDEFLCQSCGYEVHADVNAAFNIGQRGVEKLS